MSHEIGPRVTAVKTVGRATLQIRFSDGAEGVVDLASLIAEGGVFAALGTPTEFAKARVNTDAGTVEWPGGVDVCPDVLYAMATGKPVPGSTDKLAVAR